MVQRVREHRHPIIWWGNSENWIRRIKLSILARYGSANVTDTDIKPVTSPIPGKICLRAGQDGEIQVQMFADGASASVGGKHYKTRLEA